MLNPDALTPLEAKAVWMLADRGLDVPNPVLESPELMQSATSGILKLQHVSHAPDTGH
jgi:hypothetical protein